PANESSDAEDRVIELAVDHAFNAGSIVVAAGGNEGSGQVDVPSAYPHVLSVAATDASDLRASFSNFGDFVDLAAPGDSVITTAPRSLCASGYQVASGTSFSAPAVSGAVALVDHVRPGLTVSQRFELVRRSARDVGTPGFDVGTGLGVLDVSNALSGPVPVGDGYEVDDDVYWITGRFAKSHRALLRRTRRSGRATGRVSGFNDPTDVYRVELRKGDSLKATLTGAAGSRFALGIWSPRTRGLDITENRTRGRLLAYRDKPGAGERLTARKVATSGSYYVSVEAPHPDRADTTYVLTVRRG
ncbi:MAG TPA: S8 family serine peptidase, partial [Thermoleophilaceae bacterium]